jgi:CHRD domain
MFLEGILFGELHGTLDVTTHLFTYDITYSGLSLNGIKGIYFHGPAPVGQNAMVVLPVFPPRASPIHGEATITPEQEQQLINGLWYLNIHTNDYPAGAIRGQGNTQ